MNPFPLTLLFGSMLSVFATNPTAIHQAPPTNSIIFQSKDGGQTWEDISFSLPKSSQPEGFFAGASEIYLRINGVMYRSKSNLKIPVWEKENLPDQQSTSIAFNPSGAMAYSYDGNIYLKKYESKTWLPIYTNLKSHEVATIFEASDGTIFKSTGKSFAKSVDKARSWKLVQKVWVGNILETDGVLLAAGQNGIMRSIDGGDNWEWVLSEGGVGIAIEQITDGFAAIVYNTKLQSRRIHLSMDKGKTWLAVDGIPASASLSSIKQVGRYLICGHPDGIFRSADMGKNWTMVLDGVDQNQLQFLKVGNSNALQDNRRVFNIYVSGSVVYAVVRESGC